VKLAAECGNNGRNEVGGSAQAERDPVPEKRTHGESDEGIERKREQKESGRESDELNGLSID